MLMLGGLGSGTRRREAAVRRGVRVLGQGRSVGVRSPGFCVPNNKCMCVCNPAQPLCCVYACCRREGNVGAVRAANRSAARAHGTVGAWQAARCAANVACGGRQHTGGWAAGARIPGATGNMGLKAGMPRKRKRRAQYAVGVGMGKR